MEDRIFTTGNAVFVLDGASQPEPSEYNGGWLADQIGSALQRLQTQAPDMHLASLLEQAIAEVANRFGLRPGQSPSTTVAITRWRADALDVLLLCDSMVVIERKTGELQLLRDERLAGVPMRNRSSSGFSTSDLSAWQSMVDAQRGLRNVEGGYWVVEANPKAAHHAYTDSIPLSEVAGVMALTDGVSRGVDRYRTPPTWREATTVAHSNPEALVDMIHHAEECDPAGKRWPRSKCHDDKAIAVVTFEP